MVDANISAPLKCFYCELLPYLQRAINQKNNSFRFSMQVSLLTHQMQWSYEKKKYRYLKNLIFKKEKISNIKFPKISDKINRCTYQFLLHKKDNVIFAILKLSLLTRHSQNVNFVKFHDVSVGIKLLKLKNFLHFSSN